MERWLRQIVSILFVLIMTTDSAMPCCGLEEDWSASSGKKHEVAYSQDDSAGSQSGSSVCDHCYCCARYSSPARVELNPTLTTIDQPFVLSLQDPPLIQVGGVYRPPRSLSLS